MNLADQPSRGRVLYLVVCAAPPARDVHVLVDLAQKAGWDACVVATPRAFQWIDAPALSERTRHPVRYDYKLPGEPDLLSPPDAIIVAPATFNTINKWASGISDTLVLGLLCEAIGFAAAASRCSSALTCCPCIALVRVDASSSHGT